MCRNLLFKIVSLLWFSAACSAATSVVRTSGTSMVPFRCVEEEIKKKRTVLVFSPVFSVLWHVGCSGWILYHWMCFVWILCENEFLKKKGFHPAKVVLLKKHQRFIFFRCALLQSRRVFAHTALHPRDQTTLISVFGKYVSFSIISSFCSWVKCGGKKKLIVVFLGGGDPRIFGRPSLSLSLCMENNRAGAVSSDQPATISTPFFFKEKAFW